MGLMAYTDYPFVCLGDQPNYPAPIRQVEILAYDDDKYVIVQLPHGYRVTIKLGYMYTVEKHLADVKEKEYVSLKQLRKAGVPILSDCAEFNKILQEGRLLHRFCVLVGRPGSVGFEGYNNLGITLYEAFNNAYIKIVGNRLYVNHNELVDWIQIVDLCEQEIVMNLKGIA